MPTIAFCTIKGGVGKTTLCSHVAAALADAGRRVLLLDLDPQAHASLVLGLETREGPCVADAFGPRPKHRLDEIVVASPKRPGLFIAPGAPRMAALERELFGWGHRLQAIPRALKTLSWTPDVIVVDTPPSIGAFTEAVLCFADVVVAPVPTGAFALQGLGEIETAWRDVREQGGQLVAAVNLWDRRTPATNEAMEEALKDVTVPVLKARIPRSESINQAGLGYEVVFDVSPNAAGAEELRAMARELAKLAGLR
ncbi:ParA family protein [Corallococcus carmarthensis]|uniref:ParA family protein n=1 Tax=Corallococcus carmarthensis TaxID=2316728 RepID=UPI00148DCB78|nr:ParA family protein [Corallococcus carmarthensis]NOK20589.1 ParA family protein [Corallococcus carmarthensis]